MEDISPCSVLPADDFQSQSALTNDEATEVAVDSRAGCSSYGNMEVSDANVEYPLRIARFFQLQRKTFFEFLDSSADEVHTDNTLNLTRCCYQFVLKNFEKLSKSETFLSLPYLFVKAIISSNRLKVSTEEVVFEAVMKWMKLSPLAREDLFLDLLSEIRMVYLSRDYFTKRVATEELIINSGPCMALVQELKHYYRFPKARALFSKLKTMPRRFDQVLYVFCTDNNNVEGLSVYCCDLVNNTWHTLKSEEAYCKSSSILDAVSANGKIYLFECRQRMIKTFDMRTGKLGVLEHPIERTKFLECTAVAHKNIIYCIGDRDIIHRYDACNNTWLDPVRIPVTKSRCSAVSLEDVIFVTGGTNPVDWNLVHTYPTQVFNSAGKYCPLTGRWTEVSPMLAKRHRHHSVSVNGKIYVFGGVKNRYEHTNTAEVYDPLTDQWKFISPMDDITHLFSVVSSNSEIYAFGIHFCWRTGRQKPGFIIYDPERNEWKSGFCLPQLKVSKHYYPVCAVSMHN